ncbi:hypothetical protein THOD04_270001 [Vibrio owensii]|uniref:DUF3265 domain-containing protein n=1 Tax=Vibrio owensii TaxID=696485 RepID=A0AAU9Q5T3_9VIBR|nr:hypothetical protein THF1D04_250001 [Vibrio owensii]CAH1573120.1 hypothetical protein THZB04_200001 [Vibrio owensii]CAH1583914.1 hypothetical protein THOD04_270001 [Vibrio owensii]
MGMQAYGKQLYNRMCGSLISHLPIIFNVKLHPVCRLCVHFS